jgi:general stress protein 26
MSEPVTQLDPRFSDPNAAPTDWEQTEQVLATAELFWIVTVRADGRPHTSPLVAVWLDDSLYFTTGADEQKAINLHTNPHVILLTGCNTWDRGLDIAVEGDAVPVDDASVLARLVQAWAAKWDGRWRYEVRNGALHHDAGDAIAFRVTPTKVLAFGKGCFSQTRYARL